jgi:hypothetical protein
MEMRKFVRRLTLREGRNLQDTLYLLLTGIILFVVVIGLTVFMTDYLYLTDKWLRFVNASIAYSVTALYSVFKHTTFHGFSRIQKFIWMAIIETPVSIFFVLFYVELLPLPEHMFPSYFVGILLLIAVILGCLNMSTKNIGGKPHIKPH